MREMLIAIKRSIAREYFQRFGNKVLRGPFKGMEIPQHAAWDDGNATVKLLGEYEWELHDALAAMLERKPEVIINVGCAEGYYAVGLAMITDARPVFACDIDEASLALCRDYARKNNVSHKVATLQGFHVTQGLPGLMKCGRRLYIVDVEGVEPELLNVHRNPELKTSDLIVECHDFMRADSSAVLANIFSATHRVDIIRPRFPRLERFAETLEPAISSVLAVTELRPMPTVWLACWANERGERDS